MLEYYPVVTYSADLKRCINVTEFIAPSQKKSFFYQSSFLKNICFDFSIISWHIFNIIFNS